MAQQLSTLQAKQQSPLQQPAEHRPCDDVTPGLFHSAAEGRGERKGKTGRSDFLYLKLFKLNAFTSFLLFTFLLLNLHHLKKIHAI